MKRRTFPAYGLSVRSPFDLPVFEPSQTGSPAPYRSADLTLQMAEPGEVASRWSAASGVPPWQTMFPSHCHVRLERGQAGDHLLTFGRKASFHLDRDGQVLLCAPAEPDCPEWQRFLLDTALYCVSLIRGYEALHASAVRIDGGIVALVAASGGGKSALAAELMHRGHRLFADDVLALSHAEGGVLAHAGPPLMTLPATSPAIAEIGERLDVPTPDGTSWVRARGAGLDPQPLASVFILDRRRRQEESGCLHKTAPGRLLPHMLSLDRNPTRALSRFALLREMLGRTPVYRLGGRDGDLAELAARVEELHAEGVPENAAPNIARHAQAA